MKDTTAIAVAYYRALGKKNLEEVKRYLHPNIHFTDPQEQVIGKEAVLKAATGFSAIFKSLTIRAKFGSENEAVIIYDVEISNFAKPLRAASHLSFQDGLISKIDLIYDTRCFMEKKEEVSSR
jgi:SnoaL-like domain